MKIVYPSAVIESNLDHALTDIESAARTCYQSEAKMGEDTDGFVVRLKRHPAMLEFADMRVRFVVDRGVSHEIVRHRLASFAQESTRYCNYSGEKFGRELTFVRPCFLDEGTPSWLRWVGAMQAAEEAYFDLISLGASAQEARSVLPSSLKTQIVVKANLREWRQIFALRTPLSAHPQMREVMHPLLRDAAALLPAVFDDLVGEL